MLAQVFTDIQVRKWDMPLYRFAHRQALWTHLVAVQTTPEVPNESPPRSNSPSG